MFSLTKANLTAHLCAKDKGRYALDSLCLTEHGVASSDGYVLLLTEYATDTPRPDSRILIHPTDAKHAAGLGGDTVEVSVDDNGLTFEAAGRRMSAQQPEGEFPDLDGLVPDFSEASSISFDLKTLIRALRALDKASRSEKVTMHFRDSSEAASFIVRGAGAIVMPLKSGPVAEDCFAAMRAEPALV